jgi:hypothetical protein
MNSVLDGVFCILYMTPLGLGEVAVVSAAVVVAGAVVVKGGVTEEVAGDVV